VAPSLIRRAAWPLAAALALALLVGLALHGQRPDTGLVAFKPGGLLTAFAPEDAREVEIVSGRETWRFRHDGGRWQALDAPRPVAADADKRIETALRLLHNSAPLRLLSDQEVGPAMPADYALGDEALRVSVRGPGDTRFVIRFGAANPLGLAHYARVDGVAGVPLLPTYVAEAWRQAIGQ
jgi:hypothetical protein